MTPDFPPLEPSNGVVLESPGQVDSFEWLLHRMTNRIRRSLELSDILTVTVAEVREFLGTDRVKVYQFEPDESGKVVAEAIDRQRLPSLLGHSFPAEDIPPEARELFLTVRRRSIVDVGNQQIGVSALPGEVDNESPGNDIWFRPVDPCHAEYLTAMGVCSSLVVPILDRDRLWGLLVSHHGEPRQITAQELQVVQLIADQVSIAIAQSNLFNQVRLRAAQEATINRITTLLHATPEMPLQEALEQTVTALQGIGGRIYLIPQTTHHSLQLVTFGEQPSLPESWKRGQRTAGDRANPRNNVSNSTQKHFQLHAIEQHPHWQTWLEMEEAIGEGDVWAISDLYRAVMPSNLAISLISAQVRGLLIVKLQYRQQHLGYLSVFRAEIDIERIWAGKPDHDDPRQLRPRQSFETWRELKRGQAHAWTPEDIRLVREIANHFAVAIHQSNLYQQVQALNSDLKRDIQRRKQAEIKISTLNAQLEQRVLERTAELQRTNAELLREIAERERALLERQQAEASLERLSHQNELILNSAGEGIYGLDLQGKITFANPAAARMLGYEVAELIGQWMHTLLNHSRSDGTPYLLSESPIYDTLRDGTRQSKAEDLFRRRDGSSFPVEYVSTPIREQNGIVGAVVIFKDITDRQIVEQMQDEFVSIVSHEVRTPLTSIRSTLGLLASGWLSSYPDKSQRMLEIAFSNTNRLVRLINDILDIERIKFGKVTMEKKRCNVTDLMVQSVDAMRAMADKAGINLSVRTISATLWVDPDRIIQTFTNLLSNAIKFSTAGSTVWLSAEIGSREKKEEGRRQESGVGSQESGEMEMETVEAASPFSNSKLKTQNLKPKLQNSSASHPTQPYILFRVKDQGMGIPEDKLETIFDRFQQVDASNSRSRGGSGLGLTICRGIVQQHGGWIWVESKLGEGSTFCFTLPLVEPEPGEKEKSGAASQEPAGRNESDLIHENFS
ncbi:GAF domain-containing protein [Kovacikia minuta CCNUW1]|uniref:ATP-binding protein n=1 Tax=Kovacikia minuta TaxID=2931930 RepID=UPI001CC9CFFA|nr:ATP-binding protein [Kovacikia minuta]UBF24519.1 GAF domain-containing protein [Kovacikia minuta CCNUW1]